MLKPLREVYKPDKVSSFLLRNRDTGEIREKTIADHYAEIETIILDPNVPDEIREHFDTARNLLLYSWFVYRFGPVAELHALSSVEFALRLKAGEKAQKIRGLNKLFNLAIEEGWIVDKGFEYLNLEDADDVDSETASDVSLRDSAENTSGKDDQAYCKTLASSLPYFRNELAHGSGMLYIVGSDTLAECADVINQLFKQETRNL